MLTIRGIPRSNRCVIIIQYSIFLAILMLLGCGDGMRPVKESESLLAADRPEAAVALLEPFIETRPAEPKARLLLGRAYKALGRYPDAVEQFRRASQLYVKRPRQRTAARFELARTYLQFGDRTSAFQVLRIIEQSSSAPDVLREIIELAGDRYHTRQLTSGPSDNYSPTFSPDGKQIAFASFRTSNGEIYLMDLNGHIQRRVTFSPDFNDSSPTFLSTPDYIFYSSEPKTSREVKMVLQSSGSTPIYTGFNLTHIYSKATRPVLPVSFGARVPRTSMGGDRVVYESNVDGNLELYLLDLADIDLAQFIQADIKPERITFNETDDGSPTFFPDGKRIMFVSSRNGVNQLCTLNIDGQDERHFSSSRYDCYTPAVSPDGRTIAYVSARDGDWEIYLIDADGTNERQITNGIGRSIQPAFSPDGRHLAYVSDRGDSFHIYLMSFDQPVTREEVVKRLQP